MRALFGACSEHDVGMYFAMGMSPEEIKKRVEAPPEPLEIWPEHWNAFRVFEAMRTQWNVGVQGRTGLKYEGLRSMKRRLRIPPEQYHEVFVLVRKMEDEALEFFAEKSAKNG